MRRPLRDRILDNVQMCPMTGCWLWTGYVNSAGYGVITVQWDPTTKRSSCDRAHRVSYRIFVGDFPAGTFICHKCDVPLCVNPAHLYAGSPATNVRDAVARGRQRNLTGEDHGMSKLTEDDVRKIRFLYATGNYFQYQLGAMFAVTQANIAEVVGGRTWSHVHTPEEKKNHSATSLNRDLVVRARALHANGVPARQLARDFAIPLTTMRSALHRKTWAHVA